MTAKTPPRNRLLTPADKGQGPTVPAAPSALAEAWKTLWRSSRSGPVDPLLAALVIALIGMGVVMVYSASAIEATVRHHDEQYFLKRQ